MRVRASTQEKREGGLTSAASVAASSRALRSARARSALASPLASARAADPGLPPLPGEDRTASGEVALAVLRRLGGLLGSPP